MNAFALGRRTRRAAALNLVGFRAKHTFDRDALLDEVSLNAKLLGESRSKLLLAFGDCRPSDLVLNSGAKAQIEGDIFWSFV